MIDYNKIYDSHEKAFKGEGILNKIINKLPVELHLPGGYQYCGPGTKLQKRLDRGDPGINPLDTACKEHDIEYTKFKNTEDRHIADKVLAEKAWKRVIAKDSNFLERANALLVTNAMKAKIKLGMGIKRHRKFNKKIKTTVKLFQKAVKDAKDVIKLQKPSNNDDAIKLALHVAKNVIKRKKAVSPRIISVPKTGGVIPFLVPLFAGLSAVGALSGGVTGIVKAINDVKNAKQELIENKRHNQTMESISMGKGLYLKPYKTGLGLYLNPQPKN